MSFASAFLYPVLLLFPVAAAVDGAGSDHGIGAQSLPGSWDTGDDRGLADFDWSSEATGSAATAPPDAAQVRIDQRMTIRITPRAAMPMPDSFFGMPLERRSDIAERKIGKCLPVAGIAGVRPDRANRLLLLMRDRRVVRVELDRSCLARDFYSGFLMQRSGDGRLCVDRDTLLSRSGMTCRLTKIRQLVERER